METKDLQGWLDAIGNEVDYVDVKPYSHNIINISLWAIAQAYGKDEANKAIDQFCLEDLGWQKS